MIEILTIDKKTQKKSQLIWDKRLFIIVIKRLSLTESSVKSDRIQ